MKKLHLLLVLVLGLVLAACGSFQNPVSLPTALEQSPPAPTPQQSLSQDISRPDSQGAIIITVNPLNMNNPGDELVFEISLTTHSVDLSMDMATLATLTTDDGRTVQATLWDAPRGGHHVSGKLSFPASMDGRPLLEGATQLTLIIKDVDAPERIFTWDLPI